jgi:Cu(I)/Ag(I) efflux system membrane fusion protein
MKKIIVFSSVFFVVGIGLASVVLVNPLDWNWARTIGQGLTRAATDDMAPAASEERKISYWVAPMDPTYVSDKPGKSLMGMDLVPVYVDEVSDAPGIVRIDPVLVQNIGVRSIDVQRTDIPHTIRTVGTFVYDEGQISSINTKYEGWVEDVQVNYIGEEVQKGQRLFDIFSPQLVNAQQEYLDAVEYLERLGGSEYPKIIERARSLVESSRQRLGYWDITDEQINELEKTNHPKRTIAVFSPVDGRVVSKMDQALEGMRVQPGMNLYQIVDLSTIWVEAEIFEDDVPWLQVDQSAVIEVPSLSGRNYTGTVRYIYPFFNPETRTLKLSIELPNPDEALRANMYAQVTFDVPSARRVLAVPEEAVIRSGERDVVILDLGNGTFQVQEIELGVNGNDLWEVREGLAEDSRVVVSAQFLIDSESNMREAIRKLVVDDAPVTAPDTMNVSPDMDTEMSPEMEMPGQN